MWFCENSEKPLEFCVVGNLFDRFSLFENFDINDILHFAPTPIKTSCAPPRWLSSQHSPPPSPSPSALQPWSLKVLKLYLKPWGLGGGGKGPKWAQSAQKCTFCTFGAQNAKMCSFCISGAQSAKSANFRIWTPKSAKSDAETIGFISISGQGAKMTPKCILGPKMHFEVQNAILGPKCILGTKMLPGEKGPRWLRTFLHRCSKKWRAGNVIFVTSLKNFQNFALLEIFLTGFHSFWKFWHKNFTFCILHQHL